MKNVNYKMQILQEQYAQDESNTSFSEFVKLSSESDPGFFRWLFDDDELSDFDEGEHSDEWEDFLADLMNIENPYTMQDLADYINAADEWPADVEDIIQRNGWVSDCGTEFGVCHNDREKVIINDEGKAVTV